ncbi:MAG TPA: hypothetical protein VGS21_06595, partial [Acidimicrobiales bacterium]|nr:hypothetical protein [Acidimicrobiales bacterium]
MGVKVEGVRSGERVAVEDSVSKNRKTLGYVVAGALAVILLVVIVLQLTAPKATYGPAGHRFQVGF